MGVRLLKFSHPYRAVRAELLLLQARQVHVLCGCWLLAAGCWLERLTRNTLSLVVEQLPDFKFCASLTHLVNLILCSFYDPPLSQAEINVKPESLTHPNTNNDGNKHSSHVGRS
jgi:hypothetical protein